MMMCCVFLVGTQSVLAQDIDDSDKDKEVSVKDRYKALPLGVSVVQKDKKGKIISLVVSGRARVTTVLGVEQGIELAEVKADLDCDARFIAWMNKSNVRISVEGNREFLVVTEEGEDSGKSADKTTVEQKREAQGIVRGLQVLYSETDGDTKFHTTVKGLNFATQKAIQEAEDIISGEESEKNSKSSAKKGKKTNTTKKDSSKKIPSSSSLAPDAEDFLPPVRKK
jgi:hypothetical protein